MKDRKEQEADTEGSPPRILELLSQLVQDAIGVVSERLALAEDEARLEVARLRSLALGVAAAALCLLVGFQMLNAAAVVILVKLGMPLWAALLLFGMLYVLCGCSFLWWRLRKARAQGRLFDSTRSELEKDRQWLAERSS